MIKTHALRKLAEQAGGEYVLGMRDLHTHACYLIYGELKPGEQAREVRPGDGHEEILLAVRGDLTIQGDKINGILKEGEAVHFTEHDSSTIGNPSASVAIYILAGGHSRSGH